MTTTTKPKKTRKKRAPEPSVSWTAEIAHTRHRWWWYIAITWLGLTITLIALALRDWSVAGLAIVIAFGLLLINTGKPRQWRVRADAKSIQIDRTDNPRASYTLPTQRYRGYTVLDMPAGKRDTPQLTVLLLTKKKIARPQLLVLPYDLHEAEMLIQQLSDVLPYEPAESLQHTDLVLERLARWVGLS